MHPLPYFMHSTLRQSIFRFSFAISIRPNSHFSSWNRSTKIVYLFYNIINSTYLQHYYTDTYHQQLRISPRCTHLHLANCHLSPLAYTKSDSRFPPEFLFMKSTFIRIPSFHVDKLLPRLHSHPFCPACSSFHFCVKIQKIPSAVRAAIF